MNDYLEFKSLCHHGIKGQKWGIRKYQNEDGTLTAEGRARYGIDEKGRMSKEGRANYNADRKSMLKAAKEDVKNAGLQSHHLLFSSEKNAARRSAAQGMIANKYGSRIAKDYRNSEIGKKAATGGAVILASTLAMYGAYRIAKHKLGD